MSSIKAQLIDRRFVVGLDWRRTVQNTDLASQALQRARKQRAHWYGVYGEHTMGVAHLARNYPAPLYALASGFAAICGDGYGFAAIGLPDDRIWVVACSNAAPANGFDQIVSDPAQVQRLLMQFRTVIPQGAFCACWSNDALFTGLSEESVQHMDLETVCKAAAAQEPLRQVRAALPRPLLYGIAAALLATGGLKAWQYWEQQARQRADAAMQASRFVDPALVWTRAYDALANQHSVVNHQGLQELRESLNTLPTSMAGWRLTLVECLATLPAWQCTLQYERTANVGLDPTNAQFERLRPKDWSSVQFPAIHLAIAQLVVPSHGSKLDLVHLASIWQQQIQGTSALQEVLRAFSGKELGKFEEVQPEVPLDADGQPIPRPAEFALSLFKAPVTISGPLRSVDTLIDARIPVAWKALRLEVDPIAPQWLREGRTDLTDSPLKATLIGDVYAKR